MKHTVRIFCIVLMAILVCVGLAACAHKEAADHTATGEWLSDETNHWHACEKEKCEDAGDRAAHAYDNACDADCNVCGYKRTPAAHAYDNACDASCNVCGATREITHTPATALTAGDTTHWYACTVCSAKTGEVAHTFDKTVAHSDYLKAAATATTKAQYYKSCACGKASATEYFESDKVVATVTDIQDVSKVYDGDPVATPTYQTNSTGVVSIEWYRNGMLLLTDPTDPGTYKVKVTIAETATHAGVSAEREITITKAQATLTNVAMSPVAIHYGDTYQVNYSTAGDGAVTVMYKVRGADDATYTAIAPTQKGLYTARVTLADGVLYFGTSATVDYEIEARVLTGLSTNVTYSGSNTHEINLSTFGYNNVKLRVTFNDGGIVGATPTGVVVLENGQPTENYLVDVGSCTVTIVKKTLQISWTAPANLEYDGTEKTPVATLTNVLAGDDCTAFVEVAEGSNVNAGKFKSRVMGLLGEDADNYAIPLNPSYYTSPEYTITQKTLTVPALSKDYNGNNAVSYTFTTEDGLLAGDECTLTFDAADSSDAAAIAVGHYENAKMSNVLLSNGNYVINVNTCDLHILDTAALILLVSDVFTIDGEFIISVAVKQGSVKIGDSIVLPGSPDKVYEVLKIEKLHAQMDVATVGDDEVALYVDGMAETSEVSADSFLYEHGNIPEMATEFLAKAYLKTQDEGGRRIPVSDNYRPQFHGFGLSLTASVTLIEYYGVAENAGAWTPGETMLIKFTLLDASVPAALLHGLEFTMSENGSTVITGEVVDDFVGCTQSGNTMLVSDTFDTEALTPVVIKITNSRTEALGALGIFVGNGTGNGNGNYLTDFTLELYDESFTQIEGTHDNTQETFTKSDSSKWSLAAGDTCYVVLKTTNATDNVFVRLG